MTPSDSGHTLRRADRTTRDVATRTGRTGGGNRRINPDEARALYVGLGPFRTLSAVAAQLHVTHQAIHRHYSKDKERWIREADEADEYVRRKLNAETVRTLDERNRDTIRVVDKARLNYLEALQDEAFVPSGRDLAALLRIEQLIEGEATDRVEVREVREIVVRLLADIDAGLRVILDEDLQNGQRGAILSRFRDVVRGAVEATSIGAGS